MGIIVSDKSWVVSLFSQKNVLPRTESEDKKFEYEYFYYSLTPAKVFGGVIKLADKKLRLPHLIFHIINEAKTTAYRKWPEEIYLVCNNTTRHLSFLKDFPKFKKIVGTINTSLNPFSKGFPINVREESDNPHPVKLQIYDIGYFVPRKVSLKQIAEWLNIIEPTSSWNFSGMNMVITSRKTLPPEYEVETVAKYFNNIVETQYELSTNF